MNDDRAIVRSYQRIFRPERRIYQIEGHRLPVPGGVPLRWLGYAMGSLVAVIVLSAGSWLLAVTLAAIFGAAALGLGGRSVGLVAGVCTFAVAQVGGFVVGGLDWPLRLVVLPALAATLATQATPDGRPAHRYALTWLALQLRPSRRSLGRVLPAAGEARVHAGRVWIAPDGHAPALRRARVDGPARVSFRQSVNVRAGRSLGGRLRLVAYGGDRRGAEPVDRVELLTGDRLDLRP